MLYLDRLTLGLSLGIVSTILAILMATVGSVRPGILSEG